MLTLGLLLIFLMFCCVLGVFVSSNPIYSALYFIGMLVNMSSFLILLKADYFALVLLLVYVGAIAIMFLCIVMFLNINLSSVALGAVGVVRAPRVIWVYVLFFYAELVFLFFFLSKIISPLTVILFGTSKAFSSKYFLIDDDMRTPLDLRYLAEALYSDYLPAFYLSGLLLLSLLIIVMSLSGVREQRTSKQESVRQARRVSR